MSSNVPVIKKKKKKGAMLQVKETLRTGG